MRSRGSPLKTGNIESEKLGILSMDLSGEVVMRDDEVFAKTSDRIPENTGKSSGLPSFKNQWPYQNYYERLKQKAYEKQREFPQEQKKEQEDS